ncbi:MAG: alpha/beta fold hydrolase [Bacteroidota bacterium]
MNTIVLVHGAWADVSAWDAVIPMLKAGGHEVIAVNLPGHGKENTAFGSIQLQTYVDVVKKAIGSKKDIILVGHSMAGLIISEVSEQIPEQIKELVFLAAYLPRNGESLFSLAQQDPDSHVGKSLTLDEKALTAVIAKEAIPDIFAADAPLPVQDYLKNNTKAEPLIPLNTPVVLTEANFGKVNKTYIFTANDHTVGKTLQLNMVRNSTNVSKTYSLPSSHTPFISMPAVLAAIILQEAN